MAAPSNVFWDPAGHLHTNALNGRVFLVFFGNHYVRSAIPNPHNMTQWNTKKKVFIDVESE
jgi:Ni,Fe-hydrogenase I cytochrome b subunit